MSDSSDVGADKQRLREQLLAARRERGVDELRRARRAVADLVLGAAVEGDWACVAAYEPMRTEPGSVQLLSVLGAAGIEVLVPVTLPDHDLDWVRWIDPDRDGAGPTLGLDAIGRATTIVVPALAVGRDGTRLGRGGGSYDRALPRRGAGARTIALVFDDELLDSVPVDAWDVPVAEAITPSGRIELAAGAAGNTAVTPDD